jgi:ABC-type uncharacterized transport system involved in gliding motility auxiliary subunit
MKKSLLPIGIVLIISGVMLALFNTAETPYPTYLLIAGVVAAAAHVITHLREMAKRSTMYGLNALLMSAFMVAILVVVYLIAQNRDKTWDLSATGKYTLDSQTAKIIESLENPVKVVLFYSTFERASGEFEQIKTLMEEYKRHSDKLTYEVLDPSKDYETAVKYATELTSLPAVVAETEIDGNTVREKAKGQKQEDITNAIKKVTHRTALNAYFLVGHIEKDIESQGPTGLIFLKQLLERENIQSHTLRLGALAEIPKDANMVVLAGPEEDLTEAEALALRRYVLEGGALFAAFDPQTAPGATKVLQSFGVEVGNNLIIQLAPTAGSIEEQITAAMTGKYKLAPSSNVEIDHFDENHEITKDLGNISIQLHKACTVGKVPVPPDGTNVTVLGETKGGRVQSSRTSLPYSWAESEPESLGSQTASIENIFDAQKDKEGPLPLIVAAEADLNAIPDGKPDPASPTRKGKLVVAGDSDFLTNQLLGGRGGRSHQDLVLNIFNWLGGQVDLITIRQPEIDNTSVVLTAAQKSLVRNLCVVVIPIFLIPAIGIGVGVYRRVKYV